MQCISFIKPLLAAAALVALAAGPAIAQPASSKDLCEQKIASYVLNKQIIDPDTGQPGGAMTPEQEAALKRVMKSSCMLSLKELEENWEKHADNPGEFFSNHQAVTSAVTEEIFNEVFPNRAAPYTYENFVKSAMSFPALCGEEGEDEETCKREFATMFAHWMQETSRLRYQCECGDCPNPANEDCPTSEFANPPYSDGYRSPAYYFNKQSLEPKQYKYWYIGRGPKQLSWNSNYGRFGWGLLGDQGKSMEFVEDPSRLLNEEYQGTSFMSAFWFYMTPMSQKPSMHEMVTGLWKPNDKDKAANITPGFGATIMMINGAIECQLDEKGNQKAGVQNRVNYYRGGQGQAGDDFTKGTLALFGLKPDPDEVLYCNHMSNFPSGGSASYLLYFNKWGSCQMTANENPFTAFDQTPMSAYGEEVCKNGLECCRAAAQKGASADGISLEDFIDMVK